MAIRPEDLLPFVRWIRLVAAPLDCGRSQRRRPKDEDWSCLQGCLGMHTGDVVVAKLCSLQKHDAGRLNRH